MTNPNLTLIAFLMDRSGSMELIKNDTEGGYRTFLEEQAETSKEGEQVECWLTEFDTIMNEVYRKTPLNEVPEYRLVPRGMTALVDSFYTLITKIGEDLNSRPEEERPGKVVFIVLTDGAENASRKFKAEDLRELIKQQEEEYQWSFVFLGANIDAVSVAGQYGISAGSALTYGTNQAGVRGTFDAVSRLVSTTRSGNTRGGFTSEERAAATGVL
jgi:uncharacterized protein YegL